MLSYNDQNIEGVIFDVDGTIVDSISYYHVYFNDGLEGIGLKPISKGLLLKFLGEGISLKKILRTVIPDDRDENVIEMVAGEILEKFVKIDMELPLLPGVRDVFAFLKAAETKIGVATGRTSGAAYEWKRLKEKGLDGFVDVVVTASEVENRKPAPDLITECAKKLSLHPKNCLVIGDSVSDIISGKKAGAIPVAVCTGIENSETIKSQSPEAVLQSLDEIISLFE